MMPAAKHGDIEMGVDIHLCMVPTPVPAPIPLPTPHLSVVFDPFDYVPFIGATVTVSGMKRATAGTNGKVVHIPPGFPFAPKPPSSEDELFMGSSTVVADGDPMSHIGHPVLACQVVGAMSPFRVRKKGWPKAMVLPTVFNLATPTTVFIGGPPTINMMGMAMKAGFAALGKFAKFMKSGAFKKWRQAKFAHLPDGNFWKCKVFRAEPVNILNGAVAVEQSDFSLPGRLPIDWVRSYLSADDHVGLCGTGWQTIADTRLEIDPTDGSVILLGPETGPLFFDRLPSPGSTEVEWIDGARLRDDGANWCVQTKGGRIYQFPKILQAAGGRHFRIGRIADTCGNVQEFEYRSGMPAAIHLGQGRRLVLAATGGRLTSVTLTDDSGFEHTFVRYEYDQAGDLLSVVDALGAPYRFAYNQQHRMVRHTDRNGLSFHYRYDETTWRVTHAWGDGGLYDYRFEYEDTLNERRVSDSLGHVSVVKLDERGLPISEIDPLGGMTIFSYDEAGRTTAVVDPAGRRTGYAYDERGNLLQLVRPDGAALVTEFDDADKPVKVHDAIGHAWQQRFDARGLLVEQVSPLGHLSRYDYDSHGLLVTFINPRGARTQLAYDAVGHLAQLTDALGHATLFAHDQLGNLVTKGDALDRRTQYRYDTKGRLLAVTLPSGSKVLCGYDPEDNLTRYTDENGAVTQLEYFGQGEIARRIQPDGHQVEYLYDSEERLVGVRNQRGDVYRLKRDALGRIVEEVDYWGQGRRYGYDGSGYLKWSQDPLQRRIDYQCDPLGRILTKSFADERPGLPAKAGPFAETFGYDGNGNLVETANAHVKVTRSFDAEGRLVEEVQAHTAGQCFTVRNGYDEVGNRTRRVTESSAGPGHTTDYAFDLLDQSIEVRIDGGDPMRMRRDAVGQITDEELAPGLVRRYRYNTDGLMTEQGVAKDGQALFATRYDYDRAGNLTQRDDSQFGVDRYVYDPMGRILEHTDPRGRLERFFNDPAGDRLVMQVVESEQQAKVVSASTDNWRREGEYLGVQYRFDRAGNLTKKVDAESRLDFAWDANQRLIASWRETGEGRRVTIYGYDPLGRRLFKETEGERTWFGWDGDALVDEVSLGGRLELEYRPGSFEPLAIRSGHDWLLATTEPNGASHRWTDHAGHVVALSVKRSTAEWPQPHQATTLRLQGQQFDAETGLCYNRNRYFDEHISAFVSLDPLGLEPSENPYSFGPNLLGWVDPLGLKCSALVKQGNQSVLQIIDKFPPGSKESRQLRRFVEAWNREIAKNGGSMAKRSLTATEEKASAIWKKEMRKKYPARFKDKVVGHTPDACMGGKPAGGRAMALSTSVNSYLGGVAGGVPEAVPYNAVQLVRSF